MVVDILPSDKFAVNSPAAVKWAIVNHCTDASIQTVRIGWKGETKGQPSPFKSCTGITEIANGKPFQIVRGATAVATCTLATAPCTRFIFQITSVLPDPQKDLACVMTSGQMEIDPW
jgi:hypothetical protein